MGSQCYLPPGIGDISAFPQERCGTTTGAVRDRTNVEIRYLRIELTRQPATDTSRTVTPACSRIA